MSGSFFKDSLTALHSVKKNANKIKNKGIFFPQIQAEKVQKARCRVLINYATLGTMIYFMAENYRRCIFTPWHGFNKTSRKVAGMSYELKPSEWVVWFKGSLKMTCLISDLFDIGNALQSSSWGLWSLVHWRLDGGEERRLAHSNTITTDFTQEWEQLHYTSMISIFFPHLFVLQVYRKSQVWGRLICGFYVLSTLCVIC